MTRPPVLPLTQCALRETYVQMGYIVSGSSGSGRYHLQSIDTGEPASGWARYFPTGIPEDGSTAGILQALQGEGLPYTERILASREVRIHPPHPGTPGVVLLICSEPLTPLPLLRRQAAAAAAASASDQQHPPHRRRRPPPPAHPHADHPLCTDPLSEEGFWSIAVPLLFSLLSLEESGHPRAAALQMSDLGVAEGTCLLSVKLMRSAFAAVASPGTDTPPAGQQLQRHSSEVLASAAAVLWQAAVGEPPDGGGGGGSLNPSLSLLSHLRPTFTAAPSVLVSALAAGEPLCNILEHPLVKARAFGTPGLPHTAPSLSQGCGGGALPQGLRLCAAEAGIRRCERFAGSLERDAVRSQLRLCVAERRALAERAAELAWRERALRWVAAGGAGGTPPPAPAAPVSPEGVACMPAGGGGEGRGCGSVEGDECSSLTLLEPSSSWSSSLVGPLWVGCGGGGGGGGLRRQEVPRIKRLSAAGLTPPDAVGCGESSGSPFTPWSEVFSTQD